MKAKAKKKPHGNLRQSQVVTTFGPGSLMDLPNHSVIVGGLDYWLSIGDEVLEPRLTEKLKEILDLSDLSLHAPPPALDDMSADRTGIMAFQFPEWFVSQDVITDSFKPNIRSRFLVHRKGLDRGYFIDMDKKKHSMVPIRFVRACRRGHIGDIDWISLAHGTGKKCNRQLWIDERGTSGDLTDVSVRCECGQNRAISQAARMEKGALGNCNGSRPWLGPFSKEKCGEPNRLLVRSASNAYFPQVMTVISLPERNEELADAIARVWEHNLQYVEHKEQLQLERKREHVKAALADFTDEEVLQEIESKKKGGKSIMKPVKQAEMETLVASKEEIGKDRPEGNFYARALPKDMWDSPVMGDIDRVILVHRLREVVAQVGFTRFESIAPDVEGELEIGVQRAPLAKETTWIPAVENRGEGVFLSFKEESIEAWQKKAAVKSRGLRLMAGFDAWLEEHKNSGRKFFGLPYIMLHSLSHLLITAVSLECGYPASSIRERIYAGAAGFGILMYTGTPDAEGTLGGLVQVGRNIGKHMEAALEYGRLCSNDPVCAQHDPVNEHERRFLHGAACHGCLLISETSCEMRNDFLDRSLVVPTVEDLGCNFFDMG